MLGNYSKLIGAAVGNIVALVVVYLGSKGLAACTPGVTPDADQVCTVMGFTPVQITSGAMFAINMFMVWAFPANKPA